MDLSNTITETLQNINISKTDEKIKDTDEKIKHRECIELKNLEIKHKMTKINKVSLNNTIIYLLIYKGTLKIKLILL